jgi:hypothetical protein
MHLGNMAVRYLDGGTLGLDGGAMFGVVPKTFWEKKSPPDEKNRIRMRANSLLVRTHHKTILIETGNGTKWDTKQGSIYSIQEGDPLTDSLHRAGVHPTDVNLGINTHLHFDHAGGNTRRSGDRRNRSFGPSWRMPTIPPSAIAPAIFPTTFSPSATPGSGTSSMVMPNSSRGSRLSAFPDSTQGFKPCCSPGAKVARLCCGFTADASPYSVAMDYGVRPLSGADTQDQAQVAPSIRQRRFHCCIGHDPDVAAATLHDLDEKIEIEPVDLNR